MPKTPPIKKRQSFRSNRGRPRKAESAKPSTDLGTPELILKRSCNLTAEAIDLCLQRNIIGEREHRAAMHLRWLYTLCFGAPGVTALDLSRGDGAELFAEDDPQWRASREHEYHSAVRLLQQRRYDTLLLPCIIHNEIPDFLCLNQYEKAMNQPQKRRALQWMTTHFNEGLKLLADHWFYPHPQTR